MPLKTGEQATDIDIVLDDSKPRARFLISVPKRCFKHAVDRNRVKRQVREAYRKHKYIVARHSVALAFIWLDTTLRPSTEVEGKVTNLLKRVHERILKEEAL